MRRARLVTVLVALHALACSAFDPKVGPLRTASSDAALPPCPSGDDDDGGSDAGESYPNGGDDDSGPCAPSEDGGS